MFISKRILFVFIILFWGIIYGFSQSFRYGIPLHKTFHSSDYNGSRTVWCVDRLPNGTMVIGTDKEIIFYNGLKFTTIYKNINANVVKVYSLSKIYVGGDNNFGYLIQDKKGVYNYVALSDSLKGDTANFVSVLNIFFSGDTIVFGGVTKTFLYVKDTLKKVWKSNTFSLMNIAGNNLYFKHRNGLYTLKNDRYYKLKNTSHLRLLGVQNILQETPDELFFEGWTKRWRGFMKYDFTKDTLIPIPSPIDSLLQKYSALALRRLHDGRLLVALYGYGIVILNKDLTPYAVFDNDGGLPNTYINWIFQDDNNNIWIATNNGFVIIYYDTGLYYYPANKIDVTTLITKIAPIGENKLIVGSTGKVTELILSKQLSLSSQFNVAEEHNNYLIMDIEPINDNEIIAEGMYKTLYFNPNSMHEIPPRTGGVYIIPSHIYDTTYYIINGFGGFSIITKQNGTWETTSKIKYNKYLAGAFEIDSNHLGFKDHRIIYSLSYNIDSSKVLSTKIINDSSNPLNYMIYLNDTIYGIKIIDNKVLKTNTYYYSSDKDTFLKAPFDFDISIGKNNIIPSFYHSVYNLHRDSTYLVKDNNLLSWIRVEGKRIFIENRNFSVLNNMVLEKPIYDRKRKVYWFSSGENIFSIPFDTSIPPQRFNVFVESVNLQNDSVIFLNGKIISNIIPYKLNSLKFTFAAPYFIAPKKIQYQYKLYPIEKEWSGYGFENFTRYTNLSPGKYTFFLKAKNVFGEETPVFKYEFTILPPWYMTWWAYILFLILLGIIICLIIKVYTYNLKQKNIRLEKVVKERTQKIQEQKEKLEKLVKKILNQNEEIKEKNLNITQSISYARQIQMTILSVDYEDLKNKVDIFIYFKPKDIVSGDFYFIRNIKSVDSLVFAAADSTGHGVPGAFMSLLGITFLNEIFSQKSFMHTNEILEELRNKVYNSLNKKEESDYEKKKDGIDMAIINYFYKEHKIEYSGAKNPLYLIRNKDDFDTPKSPKKIRIDETNNLILYEFAADRQPVGFHYNPKPFTKIEIEVKKNDIIYIFTDGYTDQFGGVKNSKYGHKRFKQLLLSISQMPMDEQKRILDEEINKWQEQANVGQIDDQLIIGIKIL